MPAQTKKAAKKAAADTAAPVKADPAPPTAVTQTVTTATSSKKKAAPKDTSKYNDLLSEAGFPITINYSTGKKRHAVAKTDLPAGAVVCNERAAALVVSTAWVGKYCHYCVQSLNKAEMTGTKVGFDGVALGT